VKYKLQMIHKSVVGHVKKRNQIGVSTSKSMKPISREAYTWYFVTCSVLGYLMELFQLQKLTTEDAHG
jgi:hypothetical protein